MKSYIIEGNDKTIKGKQLYLCDPEKNKKCPAHDGLSVTCGECQLTTHKAFAKTNADGNPIKAPFINGNDIDSLHRDLINDLDGERKIVKIVVDIYYEGDPQDE